MLNEATIIEENANYVLGMYDLYSNDQEIITALRLKGIDSYLIPSILDKIKQPAYEKRVRQAKRMIVIGGLSTLCLGTIYFALKNLPGAETFMTRKSETIFNIFFGVYREFFYLIWFVFILQFIAGLSSYKKYSKLLKPTPDNFL